MFDLSGYIPDGSPLLTTIAEKQYCIQKYQGEHRDEYSVMEMGNGVPNGVAQLFENGFIRLSWRMVNGNREGLVTVYEDGVALFMTTWEDLEKAMQDGIRREIVNDESGNRLLVERVVTSGVVVYKGGFNPETRCREGRGVEYDRESGLEKCVGYYRNDHLVHVFQSFVVGNDGKRLKMIEYDGDESVDNVNEVLNRHPTYCGDYRFDDKAREYVRFGRGREINKFGGMCNRIIERDEKGGEIRGSEKRLYAGWYGEGDWDRSICPSLLEEEEERRYLSEKVVVCVGLNMSVARGLEELVISHNTMNGSCGDASKMVLDLSQLERLTKVVIEHDCFVNVRSLIVHGLKCLKTIKIHARCFRMGERRRSDGIVSIVDCPELCRLEIDSDSFRDFNKLELSKVDSLEYIEFGRACFYYAKCVLKDLPALNAVMFKEWAFRRCPGAILENLPKLTTISLEGHNPVCGDDQGHLRRNINGHESYDNTLVLKKWKGWIAFTMINNHLDLPSLTYIRGNCSNAFDCMGRIIVEDVSNIMASNVNFGNNPFYWTAYVQGNNADVLAECIRKRTRYLRISRNPYF